jgi:hypothetical protein
MFPFTVILGILLGSLVAIAFGLAVVAFVFWLLQEQYPRVSDEMPMLLRSAGIFTLLASAAALSFVGALRRKTWRYAALTALWLGLAATGWYYWP